MPLTGVNAGVVQFHPAVRVSQRREAELTIQAMRVPGDQGPSAQPLQIRMGFDAFHQPLGQALSPVRLDDEYIRQVGECGPVCNHAGETHLLRPLIKINPKTDGVPDGPLHDFHGNAFGPIRAGEKSVNKGKINPRGISADFKLAIPEGKIIRGRCSEIIHKQFYRCRAVRNLFLTMHVIMLAVIGCLLEVVKAHESDS